MDFFLLLAFRKDLYVNKGDIINAYIFIYAKLVITCILALLWPK